MAVGLLNLDRLRSGDALVTTTPFHFVRASGVLDAAAREALNADFPRYAGAGYFPYAAADCGASINALVSELESPAFADAIGALIGMDDLAQHPVLVTICRSLNRRHGTIHTDSRSKIATALLYFNEDWPADEHGGCLRFLARIDSIDAIVAPELKPLYGNLAAFARADNSFHGHLPFEGERRVIQVTWLIDEAARNRKTRRGRLSRLLKKLAGGIDRRIGAGRNRDAAHRD